MKKLIAIDGNSLLYRAYYALPNMQTREGEPTGAIYGFVSMLLKLLKYEPDYMLVAFDTHAPTFRHKRYTEYKAGRGPTPDVLITQFGTIKTLLRDMNIAVVEKDGYEADDILGTSAKIASERGDFAYIVTGDRDALQLVGANINVIMTKKGISEVREYDEREILEDYGITPDLMVDLKGLMGDKSDNLPGIKGVGDKTAVELLKKYGTLENVLVLGVQQEKGKRRENIETYAADARLSRELGIINCEVPLDISLDDCIFSVEAMSGAIPYMRKLELKTLIDRLPADARVEREEEPAPEPFADIAVERIELRSEDELSAAIGSMSASAAFAIDLFNGDCISLAFDMRRQYNIVTGGNLLDPGIDYETALNAIKPLIESSVPKTVYDAKRHMHELSRYGISLGNIDMDIMIADYLINAVRPAEDPRQLAREKLDCDYKGAATLLALSMLMQKSLCEMGLEDLYEQVEKPLMSVLYDMERIGFVVDTKVLDELGDKFGLAKLDLETEIYRCAGQKFNIQSPKQLGVILFEKLNLPPGRKTSRGYSTDAQVLDGLRDAHPIIPLVTQHRFLAKIKSTFIDGLIAQVKPQTSRIHTTFNQNVAMTGRISSMEPNLQNIPVRTEQGSQIRSAFVASEGNLLVDADYSQIELRVLAHMSGDVRMTEAFKSGGDIHTMTAAEVFAVSPDQVTSAQRRAAKAVNFGIVYGISDFGLAQNLDITRKEAAGYIERYFARYEGVAEYMNTCLESARKLGYAKTLFGRRRYLAELASKNYHTRSFGERVARNMPIQGTAADIIKMAMVRVHGALREGGFDAKLVLQIHDELIIDTPEHEIAAVSELLKTCMENVAELSVPLVADVNVGRNWLETK